MTAATISQVRTYRAFGVGDVVLADRLVDAAALAWLRPSWTATTNSGPSAGSTRFMAWDDDDRVERGAASGRCNASKSVPRWAHRMPQWPASRRGGRRGDGKPRLRLAGVAGYEAALGHDVSPAGWSESCTTSTMFDPRPSVWRSWSMAPSSSSPRAAALTSIWWPTRSPDTGAPSLRSGAYLTHDDGLYQRTSPLNRPGSAPGGFRPAMAGVALRSRPEPALAILTMGRRDVSFDQDLPVPQRLGGNPVDIGRVGGLRGGPS